MKKNRNSSIDVGLTTLRGEIKIVGTNGENWYIQSMDYSNDFLVTSTKGYENQYPTLDKALQAVRNHIKTTESEYRYEKKKTEVKFSNGKLYRVDNNQPVDASELTLDAHGNYRLTQMLGFHASPLNEGQTATIVL